MHNCFPSFGQCARALNCSAAHLFDTCLPGRRSPMKSLWPGWLLRLLWALCFVLWWVPLAITVDRAAPMGHGHEHHPTPHIWCAFLHLHGPKAIECFLAHDTVIVAGLILLLFPSHKARSGVERSQSARAFIKVSFLFASNNVSGSDTRPPTSGDISGRLLLGHRKLQSNNN